jgi:hypothetical protein
MERRLNTLEIHVGFLTFPLVAATAFNRLGYRFATLRWD